MPLAIETCRFQKYCWVRGTSKVCTDTDKDKRRRNAFLIYL